MADEKRDDYGLSAEDIQKIQEYRRTHDFTGNMSLQRNYQYEGEAADAFVRSKNCIKKCWEEKLYTDFGINRPIKNFSEDYPLNFLEETNADYISNIIAGFEEKPEQLDLLLNQFTEMYSDSIAKMLEAYCKSRNKTIENLIEDDILEFSDMVSGPLFDAFMHVLMVSQSVDSVFDASRENPTSEDFSNVSNNWDRANFDVFWTHCKTKLGAPLSLDQLMEEDYEAYERAVSFFENDSDGEIQYEELRAAFLDTLNSVDREIYELREQKYTESDIAYKLHYKTHSAVSKRIKIIGEKQKEFIAKRE